MQGIGKLEDHLEAGRVQSALKQRHVVALHVCIQRKLFLRQACLSTERAQHLAESDFWLQPVSPDQTGERRRKELGGLHNILVISWMADLGERDGNS